MFQFTKVKSATKPPEAFKLNDYTNVLTKNERLTLALRSLYTESGYSLYKMSKFEEYELYLKNKEFLVSDNIITFTDTDGRLLALKPDVTLSIIKNSRTRENEVIKAQYNENVYRVSGSTRSFREIMQSGIECIGDIGEREVCEVVSLAAKSLSLLSSDSVLEISSLDIVDGVLDYAGIADGAKDSLLSLIEKKNEYEAKALLDTVCQSDEGKKLVLSLISLFGKPEKVLPRLEAMRVNERISSAIDMLSSVVFELDKNASGKISIDFSLLGNMKYYNGIAFRGFISGLPAAVLLGGQYDNLMTKMGKDSRGVGFAVYLDGLDRLTEL